MPSRLRWMRLQPQELALIGITAVWGSTFLLVHWAMQHSGPWFFVGLRFLVAGLISVVIFRRVLRGIRWRDIGAGIAIGLGVFGGATGQGKAAAAALEELVRILLVEREGVRRGELHALRDRAAGLLARNHGKQGAEHRAYRHHRRGALGLAESGEEAHAGV